jgi:hypothetical protein
MHLVDDKTAPDKVQQARRLGRPFTVLINGAQASGITATILIEAMREGLALDNVAALSWNHGNVLRRELRIAIAKAMNYPPDFDLDDMISGVDPELIGSVWGVVFEHSYDHRQPVTAEHRQAVTAEYVDLVRRVSEETDSKFLRAVHRQIDAAIRLSITARLDEIELEHAYRTRQAAGERLPAWSFVVEVAQYFRDYKRDLGLADLADHLAARLQSEPDCMLALIDDAAAVPPLGLRALRRLLPNASFVLAGLDTDAAVLRAKHIFQ